MKAELHLLLPFFFFAGDDGISAFQLTIYKSVYNYYSYGKLSGAPSILREFSEIIDVAEILWMGVTSIFGLE